MDVGKTSALLEGDERCLWVVPWKSVNDTAYRDVITPSSVVGALVVFEKYSCSDNSVLEFLSTIADAISRPAFIHEYAITEQSLFSAVAVGFTRERIVSTLARFCHTDLPKYIVSFIDRVTARYGRAALVLRDGEYWILSDDKSVLETLAKKDALGKFINILSYGPDGPAYIQPASLAWHIESQIQTAAEENSAERFKEVAGLDIITPQSLVMNVKVRSSLHEVGLHLERVRAIARQCGVPLTEEYAFSRDVQLPRLRATKRRALLRQDSRTAIRPYQDRALFRVFGSGRAQSGIIVLPCGSGKTLVGVMISVTIGRPTVIVCTNTTSAHQWAEEYVRWTNAEPEDILVFTHNKERPAWLQADVASTPLAGTRFHDMNVPGVVVTTFGMLCYRAQRADGRTTSYTELLRNWIKHQTWGLLLIDEVHVASADQFRTVCTKIVQSHCRIGLTATLVREDEGISDLYDIVGPRLYEADWLDLRNRGYLSNVLVAEVRCPVDLFFFKEILNLLSKQNAMETTHNDKTTQGKGKTKNSMIRQALTLNIGKVSICRYLIDYHVRRGDKVLLFCDDTAPLEVLSKLLNIEYVIGETGESTRSAVFKKFREARGGYAIGVSRIADNSLNLPEASVVVQVAFLGGSRRQEAQRLGRILRPKTCISTQDDLGQLQDIAPLSAAVMESRRAGAHFNGGLNGDIPPITAYFYSLVSANTREEGFSLRRRRFLMAQGYAITVCTDLLQQLRRDSRRRAQIESGPSDYPEFAYTDEAFDFREKARQLQTFIGEYGREDLIRESRGSAKPGETTVIVDQKSPKYGEQAIVFTARGCGSGTS